MSLRRTQSFQTDQATYGPRHAVTGCVLTNSPLASAVELGLSGHAKWIMSI
jgi:hypothetical protein